MQKIVNPPKKSCNIKIVRRPLGQTKPFENALINSKQIINIDTVNIKKPIIAINLSGLTEYPIILFLNISNIWKKL